MPTLDRLPNRDEIAAHATAYPIDITTGGLRPEFVRLYEIQRDPAQGGLWFLRDLHGVVRASVLSVHPKTQGNPQGVLAWTYESDQGGYMPSIPPTDIVLAQGLDAVTGKSVD